MKEEISVFIDIQSPEVEHCSRCKRAIPAGEPHAGIEASAVVEVQGGDVVVSLCIECWNYLWAKLHE